MREFDEFLVSIIGKYCRNGTVLEIGCGERSRLTSLAGSIKSITCIDPDAKLIEKALATDLLPNLKHLEGRAENLDWPEETFDIVFFPLSFHHVPVADMDMAISEAVRVARRNGHIIFLEPLAGSMFDRAMRRFKFCVVDERKELAMAYYRMLDAQALEEIGEIRESAVIEFESFSDFIEHFPVNKGIEEDLKKYLEANDYRLVENYRLNVFSIATQ
jgi:ubiquinone/menaquinone biosynthesis C-methylase UbiE